MISIASHLLVFLPASIVTNGLGAMWMWRWFLTPLGAPDIGFLHALGVALFVSFLTVKLGSEDLQKRSLPETAERVGLVLSIKWVGIGVAAAIWGMMP